MFFFFFLQKWVAAKGDPVDSRTVGHCFSVSWTGCVHSISLHLVVQWQLSYSDCGMWLMKVQRNYLRQRSENQDNNDDFLNNWFKLDKFLRKGQASFKPFNSTAFNKIEESKRVQGSIAGQSYCNIEINDLPPVIVAHVGWLHAHVVDVDGAREQEEDGKTGQQQAQAHRYGHVKLSACQTKRKWGKVNKRVRWSVQKHSRPTWPQPLVAVGDQGNQLVLLTWSNRKKTTKGVIVQQRNSVLYIVVQRSPVVNLPFSSLNGWTSSSSAL